jgi:hypothetical protein
MGCAKTEVEVAALLAIKRAFGFTCGRKSRAVGTRIITNTLLIHFTRMHKEFRQCYSLEHAEPSARIQKRKRRCRGGKAAVI